VTLSAEAEDHARVFRSRDEEIHVLQQRLLDRARLLRAPQLACGSSGRSSL